MAQAERSEKVIILGSGPAGYTAALYASRAQLEPLVIDGGLGMGQTLVGQGGQLTITTEVENYPGFPEGIMGPELMMRMREQVARFGTRFVEELASSVDLTPGALKVCVGEDVYAARALIIATGASARWLGLPEEAPTWEGGLGGAGISACATCDGALPVFRGKEIMVVGGGDTACEEALFLTRFAGKVYLCHRRGELRASKIMRQRVLEHPKIQMLWNKVVERVDDVAAKRVTAAILRDTVTGEVTEQPLAGIFVAIGHKPNSELFAGQLELDPTGYIVTHHDVRTTAPGVFACGDVRDHEYRQAISAAGSGCMAAIQTERYLAAIDAGAEADW